ncbi:hypothetical protein HHI36_014679 [Cryptolaemus montrouzieri]|uniref:Uncharacterized protein n=1 Tax=Cryptolaemus montrouzieri TaxID=559131 RepID=A0ABD2N3A9_9CUCU
MVAYPSSLKRTYKADKIPIQTDLQAVADLKTRTKPLQKWKIESAYWPEFRQNIDETITTFLITEDINETINIFSHIIKESANKLIGKIKPSTHKTPVSWWSGGIAKALRETKHLTYSKTQYTENNIEFERLRSKSRYLIKKKQKRNVAKLYLQHLNLGGFYLVKFHYQ